MDVAREVRASVRPPERRPLDQVDRHRSPVHEPSSRGLSRDLALGHYKAVRVPAFRARSPEYIFHSPGRRRPGSIGSRSGSRIRIRATQAWPREPLVPRERLVLAVPDDPATGARPARARLRSAGTCGSSRFQLRRCHAYPTVGSIRPVRDRCLAVAAARLDGCVRLDHGSRDPSRVAGNRGPAGARSNSTRADRPARPVGSIRTRDRPRGPSRLPLVQGGTDHSRIADALDPRRLGEEVLGPSSARSRSSPPSPRWPPPSASAGADPLANVGALRRIRARP